MGLWLGIVLILYTGVAGFLYIFQRKLLYHPDTGELSEHAFGFSGIERIALTAEDGAALLAFYKAPPADGPLLLYFHGNAANLNNRAPKLDHYVRAGMGLFAVSYRGYGDSVGTPSEQGIYADARAAVRYVREVLRIPDARIILYGESLGSGVAVEMATLFTPALLVLEAPYLSIRQRAKEKYPYFPVGLILKDHFDTASKLSQLQCPLLLFHGEQDIVIPVHHGRTVLERYPGNKKGIFYPGTGHVDFDWAVLAREVMAHYHSLSRA